MRTQAPLPARPNLGRDHGDAPMAALDQISRHGRRRFGVVDIDPVDRQIAARLVSALHLFSPQLLLHLDGK
jgi:hypothetical protein